MNGIAFRLLRRLVVRSYDRTTEREIGRRKGLLG